MKALLPIGVTTLVMGLMSVPTMADPGDFVSQSNQEFHFEIPEIENLPPDTRRAIKKIMAARKSAYRRCQVQAQACGQNCITKYKSEKTQQALCFKANKCQAKWDRCMDQIQNQYPLNLSRVPELPDKMGPE